MSKPTVTRVGIQGAEGSFCEEAAEEFCRRHGLKQTEIAYLITSARVLKALDEEEVEYGIPR